MLRDFYEALHHKRLWLYLVAACLFAIGFSIAFPEPLPALFAGVISGTVAVQLWILQEG